MDAYELTKKYYPKYWSISMVSALVVKGKLTEDEYNEITGLTYPETQAVE